MLPGYFAFIGAIIAALGGLYYLVDTLRGKAKPNRVTWLLWGLLPAITFIAQRVQGVHDLSWVTFAAGFMPLLVFVASFFNKKAHWKTQPADYVLMIIALLGIILWAFTKNPNLAILLTIVADFSAGLPTILKSWRYPKTESWRAYAISVIGFLVCVLSIHDFSFQNSAFAIYLLLNETLMVILSTRRTRIPA